MNKEMIEEMASDMDFACVELSKEQRIEIARTLINLDYRKTTEPIRLTTIGYRKIIERIKLTPVGYGKENGCYYADISVEGQEFPQRVYFQASLVEKEMIQRETAKEILRNIKYEIEDRNGAMLEEDLSVDTTILQEVLNEIADKYGVKVEE